jgi:hypothetical protein
MPHVFKLNFIGFFHQNSIEEIFFEEQKKSLVFDSMTLLMELFENSSESNNMPLFRTRQTVQ